MVHTRAHTRPRDSLLYTHKNLQSPRDFSWRLVSCVPLTLCSSSIQLKYFWSLISKLFSLSLSLSLAFCFFIICKWLMLFDYHSIHCVSLLLCSPPSRPHWIVCNRVSHPFWTQIRGLFILFCVLLLPIFPALLSDPESSWSLSRWTLVLSFVYFRKLIEFTMTHWLELLDCAMLYFNWVFS
jgi:hypothetical protein